MQTSRPQYVRYRAATLAVVLTLAACIAVICLRTTIRSRYWAWQFQNSTSDEERAMAITLLARAGDAGWWGTDVLLADSDAETRMWGVMVLLQADGDWAHDRLFNMLADPDEAVRESAAFAIATYARPEAVRRLVKLFEQGGTATAGAAAAGLARFTSPEAERALVGLEVGNQDALRAALLIDALDLRGSPGCLRRLLEFLEDDRECPLPSREMQMLKRLAPHVVAEHPEVALAASMPSEPLETLAERAAAALSRHTGVTPALGSDSSDEERAAARDAWLRSIDEQGAE